MTIPRKQTSTEADWTGVVADAYQQPDLDRARQLVERAAQRIVDRCDGYPTAWAWSGGKDSQGLRIVAEHAGIPHSMLAICDLEWPAFLAWVTDHMPWHLTVERRPLDMDWLAAHPEMLFPGDAATAARWFRLVQHAGQRAYCRREGVEILLLGRRTADGNFTGRAGQHEYLDRGGFTRFSPIADWTHEDLLCVLGAHRAPLPPCYSWPRGFRVGTGPWPARQWTDGRGWAEIESIDPEVLAAAAARDLPGARAHLERSS